MPRVGRICRYIAIAVCFVFSLWLISLCADQWFDKRICKFKGLELPAKEKSKFFELPIASLAFCVQALE